MDVKRSWPWKKKSSDKIIAPVDSDDSSPVHSSRHNDQDLSTVQTDHGRLPEDTEAQVQKLEEKLKHVEDRLSDALMDISLKDDLAKQHTKIAEEAVSGWEKAEAEAVALRKQLDAALQQKLAAGDRVTHLDGALKECVRQLRHVREEQEQKMHEAISKKNKDWDIIRYELEEKLQDVEKQLVEAEAKGKAMSKSLEEQANTISEISDTRSRAQVDIEVLKARSDSVEDQNASLKYEIHVLSKELEIRNEERELSKKAADVSGKQHLENVRKVTRLEAECQRLRALVRKKMLGPSALAHLRFEVDAIGKEKTDSNNRRSNGKNVGTPKVPHLETLQGSTDDSSIKDTQALLERLFSMEEETKMLKEFLAKRNTELQSARLMCARTASKLSNAEQQLDAVSQSQGLIRAPGVAELAMRVDVSTSLTVSKESSQASISEDGDDDEQSNAESWASALISELAHLKKGQVNHMPQKNLDAFGIDLMDDFIEMERLASMAPRKIENLKLGSDSSMYTNIHSGRLEEGSQRGSFGGKDMVAVEQMLAKREAELLAVNQQYNEVCSKLASAQEHLSSLQSKNAGNESALVTLQEKLDMIFAAQEGGANVGKVLEQVRASTGGSSHSSVERLRAHMSRLTKGSYVRDTHGFPNQPHPSSLMDSSSEDEAPVSISDAEIGPELTSVVYKVVRLLEHIVIAATARQIAVFPDMASSDNKYACNLSKHLELDEDMRKFIAVSNQFLHGKIEIVHFMSQLSSVLSQLTRISFLAGDGSAHNSPISETSKSDGSEEAAKVVPAFEHSGIPFQVSKIEEELRNVQAEKLSLESHMRTESSKFLAMEEELARLKVHKIQLENDLGEERKELELVKEQVYETEQLVASYRVQLSSSNGSKNLADEQLANMTAAKEQMESELMIMKTELEQVNEKVSCLEKEILEERKRNDELEAKCQQLQLQLPDEDGSSCSHCAAAADAEKARLNKEQELATAAERLAECQRTILALGKQLKSLASPCESMDMSYDSQGDSALAIDRILSGKHSVPLQSGHDISAHIFENQENVSGGSRHGKQQREHYSGWDSQDVDISDILDSELANISKHGRASKMIDLFGDRIPVHEDYIEAVALMPSSPETDPVSPPKSPAKRTPRKKRSPHSLSGVDLPKSVNDVGSPVPSEKHGSSFSRFFSRNKTAH